MVVFAQPIPTNTANIIKFMYRLHAYTAIHVESVSYNALLYYSSLTWWYWSLASQLS